MQKVQQSKKGSLAWEYIAIMIIGLVVIFIVILFTTTLREKIVDGIEHFFTNILGR